MLMTSSEFIPPEPKQSEMQESCPPPRNSVKKPSWLVPAGACDCHAHIFGPMERFPFIPDRKYTPPDSLTESYVSMLATLGLQRAVIVQPSVYGLDNSRTRAAIAELGLGRARGVAMVNEEVTPGELRSLDAAGFKGVRFVTVAKGSAQLDKLSDIAKKVAPFGWHIQILGSAEMWRQTWKTIIDLPVHVVIDHLGYIPADRSEDDQDFQTTLRLLDSGHCWMKLCGYRVSVAGYPYEDVTWLARAYIAHAPENCIWGTDWPHPLMHKHMPDDGELLDLLRHWEPDPDILRMILVDNPTRLYGF